MCLDANSVPDGHGCLHALVRGLPYCDATRSLDERVADLVLRLTPEESYNFVGAGEFQEPCVTIQPEIARLDVPAMRHLVEVTSMASGACYGKPYPGECLTSFLAGLTLGSSFNRSLWLAHGVVVGQEMRALNNIRWASPGDPNGSMITLSGHGPNVNQPRDPRNGRNGELISEDPFLTGRVAGHYVCGMTFGARDQATYTGPLVMLASLKHFTGAPASTAGLRLPSLTLSSPPV